MGMLVTPAQGVGDRHSALTFPIGSKNPRWSPDGRSIAFEGTRDGNDEIYVMNADGSNVRRLTKDPAVEGSPVWSSDGRKIAFESSRRFDALEIWVMNADGSDQHNLHKPRPVRGVPPGLFYFETFPDWSPDGRHIAYASDYGGDYEIYVSRADGNHVRQLTRGRGASYQPRWSTDGHRIAFFSTRHGDDEINVLTPSEDAPAFSPARDAIAFESNREGNFDIYTANAAGSVRRRELRARLVARRTLDRLRQRAQRELPAVR
jgi:Tol biopolymer transport system component